MSAQDEPNAENSQDGAVDDGTTPSASDPAENGFRQGIRILRLRLRGVSRDYEVDFRDDEDGSPRSLSVVAGAFSTGKSSVLEFIAYCLGGNSHPQHPEIMRQVRAALLEVELGGSTHVVERAVGEPSVAAFVRPGGLDDEDRAPSERRPLRPAGDPKSLSSLLLSHCGLEGVELREAPNQAESGTDPLSIRDLLWLCFMPNERLDDKNLLFESNRMKRIKLRQVVDVVFGVHDDKMVELGSRVKELETRLNRARSEHTAAQVFLDEQELGTRIEVEFARDQAVVAVEAADRALLDLDTRIRAASDFAVQLRARHSQAAQRAQRAAALLRDRETQLRRLTPLRVQYADDIAKLTMLAEARALFDPLRVKVCPACMTALNTAPHIAGGRCSLCDSATAEHQSASSPNGTTAPATPDRADGMTAAQFDVSSELRATKARLNEITFYVEELDQEVVRLKTSLEGAEAEETELAKQVDKATKESVSPFLSQQDDLMRQRQTASTGLERARTALKLFDSLDRRATTVSRMQDNLENLRREMREASTQPDRDTVISTISRRYANILTTWRYPKLEAALIDTNMIPQMRGSAYTNASSGGRTLISLAWMLAIFEVAWETGSNHPGFLMIDSPQKNLGQGGERDTEFADSVAVADFYHHLHTWLAGPGQGAQVIVVDNSPPPLADADTVVRYSRNVDQPPYGLIDDEVS